MIRRFARVLTVSTPLCYYSAFPGKMSDCEALKETEKKYYAMLNDRSAIVDKETALQRHKDLEEIRAVLGQQSASCDAAKEAERQKAIKKRQEEAALRQKEAEEEAVRNAPIFFNRLVDLVECGDMDMRQGILRQMERTGDDRSVILYSSSEWDSHASRNLSKNALMFAHHEIQSMSFKGMRRVVKGGEFDGYIVDTCRVWKLSIFIIPTREERIVMRK